MKGLSRKSTSSLSKNSPNSKRGRSIDFSSSKRSAGPGCDDEDFDNPPVLNITVTGEDEIERPRRRMSIEMAAQTFASEAEQAVQLQLNSLGKNCRQVPPDSMAPDEGLELSQKAKLVEIIFEENEMPYAGETVSSHEIANKHSGEHGYIMFVIRRPGCVLCREQALYLKFLFQNHPTQVEGFNIVGVVKEVCDEGQSLGDFHDNYFPFPLYHDDEKMVYHALGAKKVSLKTTLRLLNPFSDINKRIKKNKIKGNFAGEGFLKGGVIIFNKDGEPTFKHEEITGFELPVSDIVTGLNHVRRQGAPTAITCSTTDEMEE